MTYSDFLSKHEAHKDLINAVCEQAGFSSTDTEDGNEFFEYLNNVYASPCGAAGGCDGFIYCNETSEFYEENRCLIVALAHDDAEELGEDGALALVKTFNGIKEDDYTEDEIARALYAEFDRDNLYGIYNILAWYALERVAYWYGSDMEDEDE
jgi:hypothetical protein